MWGKTNLEMSRMWFRNRRDRKILWWMRLQLDHSFRASRKRAFLWWENRQNPTLSSERSHWENPVPKGQNRRRTQARDGHVLRYGGFYQSFWEIRPWGSLWYCGPDLWAPHSQGAWLWGYSQWDDRWRHCGPFRCSYCVGRCLTARSAVSHGNSSGNVQV